MTEVEFFHHPSRTLVLTDFIENFEPGKLGSWWMRWLTRLGGVQDPHGSMPRDMRSTFVRQRPQLKAAGERMLALEQKGRASGREKVCQYGENSVGAV